MDRPQELFGIGVLGQKRRRAGLDGPEELFIVDVHREHDDTHGRPLAPQRLGDAQPRYVREEDIQDHQGRLVSARRAQSLVTGSGFRHDIQPRIGLHHAAEPAPKERGVIYQQDPASPHGAGFPAINASRVYPAARVHFLSHK